MVPGNVSSTAWISWKSDIKNDGCQSGFQSLMTCKASLMESMDSSWRTNLMMPQPDSQHLFLLLKRTVVMRIVWPYTWHPRGRCHCHICSIAFSVKLFDGQRGIFDRTEEMLHGCPHHPGPLRCWNCLQHHSQILHHKCHYIYGRKICHWGFAFATP